MFVNMNTEATTEREVEAITRQLQQAAAGDLTVRLDTEGSDETIVGLSQSVNEMLAELDGTLLGIQSFGVEVATETQQAETVVRESKFTDEVDALVKPVAQ